MITISVFELEKRLKNSLEIDIFLLFSVVYESFA